MFIDSKIYYFVSEETKQKHFSNSLVTRPQLQRRAYFYSPHISPVFSHNGKEAETRTGDEYRIYAIKHRRWKQNF